MGRNGRLAAGIQHILHEMVWVEKQGVEGGREGGKGLFNFVGFFSMDWAGGSCSAAEARITFPEGQRRSFGLT